MKIDMYIRKIRIRNYLVHKDTDVNFEPVTVLVGPQGGGKAVRAFYAARDLSQRGVPARGVSC
jgi:hypothetical protein